MKFWDTSALVALAFPEPWSAPAMAVAREDGLIAMWWGTPVELESAVQRAARNRRLDDETIRRARVVLDDLREHAAEISPTEGIRDTARRIVRVHELRAADAFQLAAGLSWCSHEPAGQELVSLDRRLRAAAEREGFTVLPIDAPPAA